MSLTSMQNFTRRHTDLLVGLAIFAAALTLYISTLAPGLVFGDPAEYTFVPHIWGIAHPPGYALQTVLGGLWQRLIPIGSIAYRANLLSAAAGAGIAALAYGIARTLTPDDLTGPVRYAPGVLSGFSAATFTDIWQHSLHANAHIVTALLASASLFTLIRWWHTEKDGWLHGFSVLAGLSVTHHPLLVFSFPAYTAFIIAVRPRILLDWRKILTMLGFALLGLSVWLYLPLRGIFGPPPFGPANTATFDGFLDLVLARGLRVNLFHYGLADQLDRFRVFWSLLNLQANILIIALMLTALIGLWRRWWRIGLLFTLFVISNYLFIINTIQDVMAYLMVPFAALSALAGIGLGLGLVLIRFATERDSNGLRIVAAAALVMLPVIRAYNLAPIVSLREFNDVDQWVTEVYDRFEGRGEGAVLLGHWEHLTPLWYEAWVQDNPLDEEDVTLVFVATTSARPWVDNVWENIEEGPIYVSGYQRELIDEGFRLRPEGPRLYRVLPPPAEEVPTLGVMLNVDAGSVDLVGAEIGREVVEPGGLIPLTLAFRAPDGTADIVFPYATLADRQYPFTTDSHLLSPAWQPGEIIVERFDIRAPLAIDPGDYVLEIGLNNLTTGDALTLDGAPTVEIGTVHIIEPVLETPILPDEDEESPLLANINYEAGLRYAIATGRGQRRIAPWNDPLVIHPGDALSVRLGWMALSRPTDNYKVFVHLIDSANQVVVQADAPPLGGAFPTYLWFPKWVPGQTVVDPYRLIIPPETPPGDYLIEIGMYGFTTFKRAPFYDPDGNLSGDRFILGTVRVTND